jgi:hypothetical protein
VNEVLNCFREPIALEETRKSRSIPTVFCIKYCFQGRDILQQPKRPLHDSQMQLMGCVIQERLFQSRPRFLYLQCSQTCFTTQLFIMDYHCPKCAICMYLCQQVVCYITNVCSPRESHLFNNYPLKALEIKDLDTFH